MKKSLSKWQVARRKFEKTHPNYYRNYKKNYQRVIKDFIIKSKDNKPCMDCRVPYPHFVLDYDHVRGTKINKLSRLMDKVCLDAIRKEIAKCDLVCSNCHRIRTWKRGQYETHSRN